MGPGDTIALTAKRCKLCGQRFTNDAAFCPFDGEPLEVISAGYDTSADPLLNTLVDGRYHVLDSLGEGGMGTVYRARHRALQRDFAMKVLRADLAREKDLSTRFIQEARTAATLNHPNVVQITDFGELPNGTPYFVMEYLDGQPLATLLKGGGPLPAARAVRLLLQVAAGIGAAHKAGIVHRDLKPENIFVMQDSNGQDQLKILDFGVAKVAGSAKLTRTGMVFGSPHYMSPEQASGQPVDHRADIYALGVVMYELFTGRVPFEADTYMGVLTKHMFMEPERFMERMGGTRELGALEDITLRCLEKKPENRFSTVEELVEDVEEMVKLGVGDDLEVRPSRIGDVHSPSSSSFRLADELELPLHDEVNAARAIRNESDARYRWAVLAIAGAALLLLGAVGALLWARSSAGEAGAVNAGADASPSSVGSVEAPSATVAGLGANAVDASGFDASKDAEAVAVVPLDAGKPPPAVTTVAVKPPRPPKRPPPPPTSTSKGGGSGSSEIVNPWAN